MTKAVAMAIMAIFLAVQTGISCTIFSVKSSDGAIIVGRSNEFGYDLESDLAVVPRGFIMESPAPGNKKGLKWKCKYGYIGATVLGSEDGIMDGINEAGLSAGGLYLPGYARYQSAGPEDTEKELAHCLLVNWMLGNFASVDEVKTEIKKIVVFNYESEEIPFPLPLHFAVHDAYGGSIVIEYVGGELYIYDNPLGVMTNSPPFDWQITNLRNYVNLTNINAFPIKLNGVDVPPMGQGSGLLGMPGDYTPPGRFVRTAFLAASSLPAQDAESAVNLAFHILNTVDIPLGAVAQKLENGEMMYEETQWIIVRDLTSKKLYFRTYDNLSIGRVDLKKLDFSGNTVKHIQMDTGKQFVDVTDKAKQKDS